MALYHLNLRSVSRGDSGRGSAAAKYAYITRTGRYRNYDEKEHEIPNERVAAVSGNMPQWVEKPEDFWKSADRYERRNARLAFEIEVALPVELTHAQQRQLVEQFVNGLCGSAGARRLPYTWAIHRGKGHNPHAHIVVSERMNDGIERPADRWFSRANKADPAKGGAAKTQDIHGQEFTQLLRAAWAKMTNKALRHAGRNERVDPRSYAERGIEEVPGRHRGVTRRVTRSRNLDPIETILDVDYHNHVTTQLGAQLRELDHEVALLQAQLAREKAEELALTLPPAGQTRSGRDDGGRGR